MILLPYCRIIILCPVSAPQREKKREYMVHASEISATSLAKVIVVPIHAAITVPLSATVVSRALNDAC